MAKSKSKGGSVNALDANKNATNEGHKRILNIFEEIARTNGHPIKGNRNPFAAIVKAYLSLYEVPKPLASKMYRSAKSFNKADALSCEQNDDETPELIVRETIKSSSKSEKNDTDTWQLTDKKASKHMQSKSSEHAAELTKLDDMRESKTVKKAKRSFEKAGGKPEIMQEQGSYAFSTIMPVKEHSKADDNSSHKSQVEIKAERKARNKAAKLGQEATSGHYPATESTKYHQSKPKNEQNSKMSTSSWNSQGHAKSNKVKKDKKKRRASFGDAVHSSKKAKHTYFD